MTPQEQALDDNPMDYFTQNVDAWTEKEWFERLIKAVKDHDKARVSGDDLRSDTCTNIIISTAFILARDYEQTIRQALQAQAEKDRVMKLMAEALESAKEELWDCHSHCDPETSNNSDAMAWRDCRDALSEYQKLGGTQDE